MNTLSPNYWINLLPINWRSLEKKWNSKENYQEQLMINVNELVEKCIEQYKKYGEISILDIWWNNSSAIKDLKTKLTEKWIHEWKIKLNKIDIENINDFWINFLNWDLEDDDFLIEIAEKIWINSQSIIFMNQVSQYLWDRFKIIKFICEILLKKGWKMYFNIIPKSFYTWTLPVSIYQEELNKLILNESIWFDIKTKNNLNLSDLQMYEVTKKDDLWVIEFPEYRRVWTLREVDWFKISIYDFRKRTNIKTIKTRLETIKKIQITHWNI